LINWLVTGDDTVNKQLCAVKNQRLWHTAAFPSATVTGTSQFPLSFKADRWRPRTRLFRLSRSQTKRRVHQVAQTGRLIRRSGVSRRLATILIAGCKWTECALQIVRVTGFK
jgi:hypothetical protein